jgi:lambda family phage tail tape measure protein
MTNFIGRLGVTLGLDSAEFTRGIEGAKRGLQAVGQFAQQYGAIAATSFSAASVAAARYADELVDVAKANDVTIGSIIQLRDALAKSGGEAGNASKFLSSFTQYIDKAAEGSFEAQKTLKGLGITLEDLRTLNIEELFRKAASGLAAMEDGVTRNAKGIEIFSKSFKGVDARDFNEGLQTTTRIAKQHEDGIKAAADAYDNLGEISRRVTENMAAFVGPTLKKITESIKNNLDTTVTGYVGSFIFLEAYLAYLNKLGNKIAGVKDTAGSGSPTPEAIAAMANVGGSSKPLRIVEEGKNLKAEEAAKKELDARLRVMNLREQDRQRIIKENEELFAYQAKNREAEEEAEKKRQQRILDAEFDRQNQREEDARGAAQLYDQRQQAQSFYQQQAIADEESAKRQLTIFNLQQQALLMKDRDVKLAEEILQLQFKYADKVKEINENQALTDKQKQDALWRQKQVTEAEFAVARERHKFRVEIESEDMGTMGFFAAAIQQGQNARTAFQYGGDAFRSMVGSMDAALTKFVQTGKLSFKDLTRSIIQDLILIQMRAQATALFSRLVGGLIGNVGSGGFIGPGLARDALPADFNQYLANPNAGVIPMMANGGPVSGNSPYIVGERGPELFVPQRSGMIVPTNQLANAMGGQTINYNGPYIQQMSAIDTQSGMQFLAQNKQAVWAANQSAQRSLPVSR